MPLTAAYDQTHARVTLTLTEPTGTHIIDHFDRNVTNGWGQATSGHPWTVTMDPPHWEPGFFVVADGVGRMVHDDIPRRMYATTPPRWGDVEATCQFTAPVIPTGAPATAGLVTSYIDIGTYLAIVLVYQPNARVDLVIWHKTDGDYTLLASRSAITRYTAGHRLHLRVQDLDASVRARIWRADQSEPDRWHVQARAPGRDPGRVGVRTTREPDTTSTPASMHTDNLRATLPGDRIDIARSSDRIRWTAVRGAQDLSVADAPFELLDYEFTPDTTNHYRAILRTRDAVVTRSLHTAVDTPLDRAWLKWPARPFLNTPVLVSDVAPINTAARHGLHSVIGRRTPVAVTSVRSARSYTLTLVAETATHADDLDLSLAPGDTIYLQTPEGLNIPGGYYQPGQVTETRYGLHPERLVDLELTEVAAPGPDVTGANLTWQSILAAYPTWTEITETNWSDLLERSGGPGDILVP